MSSRIPKLSVSSEVVAQMQAGDEASFATFFAEHRSAIFTVALRFVQNQDDAEDILLVVVEKIWRSIRTFDNRSCFDTWIYAIARNTCITFLRKEMSRKRHRHYSLDDTSMPERDLVCDRRTPLDEALLRERATILRESINLLPGEKQKVVWCHLRGFDDEMGASKCECPKNTYRTRLCYAKRKLAELLRDKLS